MADLLGFRAYKTTGAVWGRDRQLIAGGRQQRVRPVAGRGLLL
jgi:hypothetical protein